MSNTSMREVITDAIGYWEPRRIAYNAVLSIIVLAVVAGHWPDSRSVISANLLLQLFLLAVVANVLYCAAYIVDIVAQYSGFRDTWRGRRWILLTVGIAFAGTIARFISMDMFGPATG